MKIIDKSVEQLLFVRQIMMTKSHPRPYAMLDKPELQSSDEEVSDMLMKLGLLLEGL